jgi:serpin B
MTAADDAFGIDLYRLLAEHAQDTVFSPVSVSAALRMVLCGARGDTAAELAAALHIDVPATGAPALADEALADSAADGLRELSDLVREVAAAQSLTFRVANTVWVQAGLPLLPAFTGRLRQAASASIADADFARAPEAARAEINRVIEKQTEGKITGLLAPGVVSGATRLVLANALYLKAPWAERFPESATRDEPFYPGDSSTAVTVPMMRGTAARAYLRGNGYQAVLLPYLRSRLAMAIVLPDGPLAGLSPVLAAGGLRGLLDGTSMYQVDLSIPRFRIEAAFELSKTLRQLGITRAFSGAADFSGMTTAAKLAIDAVAHKAYVDVDEQGTEAAAATAVTMRLLAITRAPQRVQLVVDRPFLFAIIDTPTSAPLFLGQVTNPRTRH